MKTLYLDIETIPSQAPGALAAIRATIQPPGNISKAETIQKWMDENADAEADKLWRKTALDGSRGEIVCIGMAIDDSDPVVFYRTPDDHVVSEERLLMDFFDSIYSPHVGETIVVGHNVKDFDLRFLFQRSVINGVRPSFDLGVGQRYPAHVYDTMTEWAGWGNRISLTNLCAALGIHKDNSFDGSMVWDAVVSGKTQNVVAHCRDDIRAVREVHRRMTFAVPAKKEAAL